MSNPLVEILAAAQAWLERGTQAGWFGEVQRLRLAAVEHATPGDLFAAGGSARPLVVALFGGTGVGKSSLLNRLAGAPVARVGAERPTSHEVTVYAHETAALAELPAQLPVERVRVQRHKLAEHSDILWIDAPDIDSVEEANRETALAWLPHVDLLCYVVSPERYRDDAGWRVLRARGHRHGWLFVMNRWDEGDARQRDDFRRMLCDAGFADPLLLCTSCAPRPARLPTPDEFPQIHALLRELLDAHAVRELTRLGLRVRLHELRAAVNEIATPLGTEQTWRELSEGEERRWAQTQEQLARGMGWVLQSVAARFAIRNPAWPQRLVKEFLSQAKPGGTVGERSTDAVPDLPLLSQGTWDEWCQAKLVSHLDALEQAALRSGLATATLRAPLECVLQDAGKLVVQAVQDQVRVALVQPGLPAARLLRRVTGCLMTALPAIALAAVGYRVVRDYFRAGAPYLGTDFAVHSLLLVFVAWAFPFLLDRLLRPSVEQAVARALDAGFAAGTARVGAAIREHLAGAARAASEYREEGARVVAKVDAAAERQEPVAGTPLARILAQEPAELASKA